MREHWKHKEGQKRNHKRRYERQCSNFNRHGPF